MNRTFTICNNNPFFASRQISFNYRFCLVSILEPSSSHFFHSLGTVCFSIVTWVSAGLLALFRLAYITDGHGNEQLITETYSYGFGQIIYLPFSGSSEDNSAFQLYCVSKIGPKCGI
jgi:hypothetical protein